MWLWKIIENYLKEHPGVFTEYEIDYIVLAGFVHILSSDFIKKYETNNRTQHEQ